MITGCFDIFHIGHLETIDFAKKHCDILIIGLDNDRTVKLNKGERRPIFKANQRAKVIAALQIVDYIFIIKETYKSGSPKSEKVFDSLITELKPDSLVSHPPTDSRHKNKEERAKRFHKTWIPHETKTLATSTWIIKKLEGER